MTILCGRPCQDGKVYSPGSTTMPSSWNKAKCPAMEKGWGYYVIHFDTLLAESRLEVDPEVLLQKGLYLLPGSSGTAHSLCVLPTLLDSNLMISFIDNSSGFFALRKGYCKDEAICNLIAAAWRFISRMGWHLHLEWVRSEHNISDQVSRHRSGICSRHSLGGYLGPFT